MQLFCYYCRDPGPAGSVLPVHHDEVKALRLAYVRQAALNGLPSGPAHHISQEKNSCHARIEDSPPASCNARFAPERIFQGNALAFFKAKPFLTNNNLDATSL
jgi:hypothetical protein